MKFTGTARRERPDFTDEQLLKWVRELDPICTDGIWRISKPGRGVIFINLHEARIDDDRIFFSPHTNGKE